MEKVLITGGSGLIGRHLIPKLIDKGYEVVVLSRYESHDSEVRTFWWDVEEQEVEEGALENVDHIIHLAGANIGEKRWTVRRKMILMDSRIKSALLIFEELKKTKVKLKSFISASAIGYYGAITADKIFSESDPPADDFIGQLCSYWERSADKFKELKVRTVKLRTGLVLTPDEGVLVKMIFPINAGFGSPLGSGKQFSPWIHIDDLCEIYIQAITMRKMSGSYNAVSPDHINNKVFTHAIAHSINKKLWMPNVPSGLIRLMFGKMADIILNGSRLSAKKIVDTGFTYKFRTINEALQDLIGD